MPKRGYESKYILSEKNKDILDEFINDFKIGRNVSVSKGGRKETTLKKNYFRVKTLCSFIQEKYGLKDITKVSEEQILTVFERMEKGVIKTQKGGVFTSVDSYQSTFKCFWNWLMKSRRKQGITIPNIIDDIIVTKRKPEFVHFTNEDVTEMAKYAKPQYRTLMWFLFDSGCRPQEMKQLLVDNISKDNNDVVWLNIPTHVAKRGSFGRKIKLLKVNYLILDWIKNKKPTDLLFEMNARVANQYLGRLSMKVLGKKITLYDFRHNSCCYWINIYKKDQALKYRFGWKKSDMIEYYSRYIGLYDDVNEDDLISDEVRTKLEDNLAKLKMQMALKEEQDKAEINELKDSMTNLFQENKIKSNVVSKSIESGTMVSKEMVKEVLKEMIKAGEIQL